MNAIGTGSIQIKNMAEIPEMIHKKGKKIFKDYACTETEILLFQDGTDKQLTEWLAEVAPYTVSGCITLMEENHGLMCGYCRYQYENGNFLRQEGEIVYDLPATETEFTGKSGSQIVIQRWGHDDYEADWDESYSVRGTLKQILDEIKNEL